MSSARTWLDWRVGAFVPALAIGVVSLVLMQGQSALKILRDSRTTRRSLAGSSWDRYKSFQIAYRSAVANGRNPVSLTGFITADSQPQIQQDAAQKSRTLLLRTKIGRASGRETVK